eukprot:15453869-Alexandrium_andersonii.AAC.1
MGVVCAVYVRAAARYPGKRIVLRHAGFHRPSEASAGLTQASAGLRPRRDSTGLQRPPQAPQASRGCRKHPQASTGFHRPPQAQASTGTARQRPGRGARVRSHCCDCLLAMLQQRSATRSHCEAKPRWATSQT